MKIKQSAISSDGTVRGLEKGRRVEKRSAAARPVRRRKTHKKVLLCRELIREVAGLAPYEKRMMEAIKTLGGSADKKIYKVAKQRLGTHKRALSKRSEMKGLYSAMRAKAAQDK